MKLLFMFCITSMLIIVVTANSAKKNISSINMKGTLSRTFFLPGENSGKNTVCSPLSVLMPLGKLALGAENDTLKELLLAIGIFRMSKIQKRFKSLLAELQSLPGGMLVIASRVYISDTDRLRKKFVDDATEIFNSSAHYMSFLHPDYAAFKINVWVSWETHNVIREIITPSDLSPLTSLVLINAVYFNGRWKETFHDIDNKVFYTPAGQRKVPTMTRTGDYNYTTSEALSAQIIQIPYVGEKALFVIVLPTKREGLDVLLNQIKLAPALLDSAMSKMEVTRVKLSIPKFKIKSQWNLQASLEQAGVKKIFNMKDSNLSKISLNGNVHVSSAIHKASIDVHQFGSEAGASSSLSNQKPEEFVADHPFLFFILVKKQQLVAGTLLYPHLN